MGREIRIRATSYSLSRFLFSAGTSYVFCRVINFFKFSVAFFVFGPWGVFTICQPDMRGINKTWEAYQRLKSAAIMMYKSLHGMTPEYLSSRFVSRNDVTSYRLRNTENKLALPQPRTNYLKKSFSYRGAGLWNSLSSDLRAATSLHNFKFNLRHHSFE